MSVDVKQIGQRLRAYRMGANLTPEQVADRLGISRAALYKYEKDGVIKLETLERLSTLLGVSTTSLHGSGVEYFANVVSFLERMRQLEAESDQVITYYESLSLLLTTPNYTKLLRQMLVEGLPSDLKERNSALIEIDRVIAILEGRRRVTSGRTRWCSSIFTMVLSACMQTTLASWRGADCRRVRGALVRMAPQSLRGPDQAPEGHPIRGVGRCRTS